MSRPNCPSGLLPPLLLVLALAAIPAHADTTLRVGGAAIRLHGESAGFAATPDAIHRWVRNAASAVNAYYGRFPVPQVDIRLRATTGRKVVTGTTYGYGTPHINVRLGREARGAALTDDWVMTHEMVHLAVPDVDERHLWFEEGVATYVEPLARAQAGQLSAERVWGGLANGLPQGLPRGGDRGLDNTHTWGRTYWGGALFCLLADVEIRRRTDNRKGLQDALQGIVSRGGDITVDWPIARVLHAGDEAVGVPVLTELYRRMAGTAVNTDLGRLWQRLGVTSNLLGVHFDDNAPLAAVRRAITAGGAGPPLPGQSAAER